MILDHITDWLVTAWELIGLMFLSAGAAPVILRRADQINDAADVGSGKPASVSRGVQQPHFA